jgi:LCP family protein required for cell wall assembly
MSDNPRHIDKVPKSTKKRVLKIVASSLAVILVIVLTGGYLIYRHLDGNITKLSLGDLGPRPDKVVKKNVPHQPLNILLLGSDTRQGKGNHIGGATPGLSDTAIVLHLSADRKHAYGVSIPRDSMVKRPSCERKDGNGTDPGGLSMFNEAYAVGGASCTVKTVEHLTHIRMDHFVVIDFNGFKQMVDALGGVEVCLPEAVHDTIGHINLPAGTYNVKGDQALNYVRVRHMISENGDIGRMKRQQAFLASMSHKAVSAGTLINPVRLYKFLDAATKSLTTDPGLAHLSKLVGLAKQLKGIGLGQIQFLTVPFEAYAPDPNRLVWSQPAANKLWHRLNNDMPLTKMQSEGVTTAKNPTPGASPTSSPNGKKESADAKAKAAETAHENGLCA